MNKLLAVAASVALGLGAMAVPASAAQAVSAPKPANVKTGSSADKMTLPKDLPASKGTVGKVQKGVDPEALRKAPKGQMGSKNSKASGKANFAYPTTACATSCYNYAGWGDDYGIDTATGFSASMTIANSFRAHNTVNNNMGQSDAHALLELAAINPGTTGRNIVEIGSTNDVTVCGAGNYYPCLFVYSWINGTGKGYNNAVGSGFVDLSGGVGYSPVHPGDSLLASVGTSKNFGVRYYDNASSGGRAGWWVWYDGLFVGYYPIANWTSVGETFTVTDEPQQFAEIAGNSAWGTEVETCTDLGNGKFASDAAATAMTNYVAYDTTETLEMDWFINQTDSAHWSAQAIGTPANTVRVGGPGWNSIGTGVGYAGTCGPAAAGTSAASSWQFWREIAPDNQLVTGASNAVNYTYTSTPIGTCFTVLNWGTVPIHAFHNNAGSSGKTVVLYKTNNCTGTSKSFGNQVKEAFPVGSGWDGYNIRTFKRTV